jgi:hypothetical protein
VTLWLIEDSGRETETEQRMRRRDQRQEGRNIANYFLAKLWQ